MDTDKHGFVEWWQGGLTVGGERRRLGKFNEPKGDAVKVGMAMRLRRETTMTVAWIAGRLGMGSRGTMSNLLNRK